jgi:hypothetical protein
MTTSPFQFFLLLHSGEMKMDTKYGISNIRNGLGAAHRLVLGLILGFCLLPSTGGMMTAGGQFHSNVLNGGIASARGDSHIGGFFQHREDGNPDHLAAWKGYSWSLVSISTYAPVVSNLVISAHIYAGSVCPDAGVLSYTHSIAEYLYSPFDIPSLFQCCPKGAVDA